MSVINCAFSIHAHTARFLVTSWNLWWGLLCPFGRQASSSHLQVLHGVLAPGQGVSDLSEDFRAGFCVLETEQSNPSYSYSAYAKHCLQIALAPPLCQALVPNSSPPRPNPQPKEVAKQRKVKVRLRLTLKSHGPPWFFTVCWTIEHETWDGGSIGALNWQNVE